MFMEWVQVIIKVSYSLLHKIGNILPFFFFLILIYGILPSQILKFKNHPSTLARFEILQNTLVVMLEGGLNFILEVIKIN